MICRGPLSLGRPLGHLIFSLMALIMDPILILFKGAQYIICHLHQYLGPS